MHSRHRRKAGQPVLHLAAMTVTFQYNVPHKAY